jgi:hypothetical protein
MDRGLINPYRNNGLNQSYKVGGLNSSKKDILSGTSPNRGFRRSASLGSRKSGGSMVYNFNRARDAKVDTRNLNPIKDFYDQEEFNGYQSFNGYKDNRSRSRSRTQNYRSLSPNRNRSGSRGYANLRSGD